MDADTNEDYLWAVDIKFDEAASGFTIKDKGNRKVNTCVRRNDVGEQSYIAVRRGGSEKDIDNYCEIDPENGIVFSLWVNTELQNLFLWKFLSIMTER